MHIGLIASRQMLPWIAILLVSAAVTYAINGGLTSSSATPYGWPAVSTAPRPPEIAAVDVRAYETAVRDFRAGSCTSLFGSYNFWLYDKDRRGPCGLAGADAADPPQSAAWERP
jgi:hypothetical protein